MINPHKTSYDNICFVLYYFLGSIKLALRQGKIRTNADSREYGDEVTSGELVKIEFGTIRSSVVLRGDAILVKKDSVLIYHNGVLRLFVTYWF